ncbi:MAG TPA: APC family permease [Nocardioides sp.]|uniref:APC family permease n=1 Tax=uncultured Nocardioides sp. TaxID=198441 RepID=UPI000EE8CF07|nr:APC family permease [uncultured Nocardioides sp.]HCB06204.1 APC family permease [Nocardioides sp.]HRD62558.1 APC family permease [Nocardioides sp.]HRI95491.1 APC family permease [Nocardioides sp.]HRK45352.1 APC family permease [Nocardioides sp.]
MEPTVVDETVEQRSSSLRRGAIGTRHLVFFVVSAAAPLTVMAGFAPLAFLLGGQTAPVAYLVAGIVCAVFAVGFTAMSRYVQNAGAFYAYITRGLGGTVGAGSAMVAYVGYTLGEIGFCSAAGLFASTALDQLVGVTVSWGVCAVALGLIIAVVSYCRVDLGARVLAVLLLGEVGLLALLSAAILVKGAPEGLSLKGFDPSTWSTSAMGSLFVITFVVYVGFEQTAVYAEEARDPRRTVPRATYIAVFLLAAVYTFTSWILLMAIGPGALADALAGDPSTLVFGINQQYLGTAATDVMLVLIVTSFFAGVLALHNAGSRYLFALGREGLLPARLAHTDPRSSSPTVAVVVQGVLVVGAVAAFGLSSLDPYTQVVIWTNTPTLVAVLVLQLLTSVAVIRFLGAHGSEDLWHRLIAPALSVVLIGAVLYLVCSKLSLLTGLGPVGNILINVPLIVAFVAGVVRAQVLKARRPEAFVRLGGGSPEAA